MSFDGKHFTHKHLKLSYQDSFLNDGLKQLDKAFLDSLPDEKAILMQRNKEKILDSERIIELALVLESYLLELYGNRQAYETWQQSWHEQNPITALKKLFFKKAKRCQLTDIEIEQAWIEVPAEIKQGCDDQGELFLAKFLMDQPDVEEKVILWSFLFYKKGYDWEVFALPEKRDHTALVKHDKKDDVIHGHQSKPRDGFNWTETPSTTRNIYHESNYCIYCHTSGTDFCRSGFPIKKGEAAIKKDVFDEYLTGCPLDEKISEMNWLMAHGSPLAALIVVMIDNPMVPATGHRICNECMRSCIYQKQDPVNIPKIESFVLDQVLALPWGVEIYDLLCRWHPLRIKQWILQPPNHKHVFIMGMGPAGFSMAHHLLMMGCDVFGADGLSIDELPQAWIDGPIETYQTIYENGEERQYHGFGGVSEYGITSRWDKNYLKLIQISLLRRRFTLKGNIRFGGNVTVDSIWRLGFQHLTIALGAGLPRGLNIPNSLAPGMRQANDFLMALHQGAYQTTSDMEIRLPAVVVGSGLTAIDTATELQAYYIRQIERLRMQYHFLEKNDKLENLFKTLTPNQQAALQTMLMHADQAAQVKLEAKKSQNKPYYGELIQSWGGVTVVYRRSMQDSPAYRLNPEEIEQGLNEGILYRENLVPIQVDLDEDGYVNGLVVKNHVDEVMTLEAGSVFVATGAAPNVAYTFEHAGEFEKDQGFYANFRLESGELIKHEPGRHCKDKKIAPLTSYSKHNHTVSVIGDGLKAYHGSVVRAIASAKEAYEHVYEAMGPKTGDINYNKVTDWFDSKLVEVIPVVSDWQQVVFRAPSVAQAWQPGNMIRLSLKNGMSEIQFPALVNGNTLSFYHRGEFNSETVSIMGPSGVRFSLPKIDHAKVLIDVDKQGLNACIALVNKLIKHDHSICIVASHDGLDLLKTIYQSSHNVTIQSQQAPMPVKQFTHVWVLARPERVKIVETLRQEADIFTHDTVYTAATYGPMQCMLKGVCAQCLQWQVDPQTGRRTKAVYACSWQHQPMDLVDWSHAQARQNWHPIVKTINQLWFKYQRQQ